MSRTEGISFPRLPARHARATSPRAIQPHPAASTRAESHRRSVSEPCYTAFVGTPRQDVPTHVYRNAAMFDDVFDKKGQLLLSRNTPKITAPLNSLQYNSLHDPHCRKLFLKNKKLRSHLMHLGLITEDLKVVATTTEQRQKIRAHELLERKEELIQKLETHEEIRIAKLQKRPEVPSAYRNSIDKAEERRERARAIQRMKIKSFQKAEEERRMMDQKRQERSEKKLKAAIEEARLMEQARRNAARAQQELAEVMTYQKRYGKYGHRMAAWHRESDRIHNQMVAMERKHWKKTEPRQRTIPSETSDSTPASRGSFSTTPRLPSIGTSSHVTMAAEPTNQSTEPAAAHEEQQGVQQDVGGATQEELPDSLEKQGTDETVKELGESVKGLHMDASGVVKEEPQKKEEEEEDVATEDLPEEGVAEDGEEGVEREEKRVEEEGLETEEARMLDPEQGSFYLTQVFIDMFNRIDQTQSGYITTEDFIQVLNSRDLGLQLNEEEMLYMAEQSDMYGNGYIPFVQVAPVLPEMLKILYNQRAEQSMSVYSVYPEEQWCQLHPVTPAATGQESVCYLHKLTGAIQLGGRPQDFRPFLKDDAFEEAIVDFFETADTNKDGVLDYNDFYALLTSPIISSRVYNEQAEDLLTHYLNTTTNPQGWIMLENFAPLARALLLMIYQNTYPSEEEWIELESRKFGNFFFNKQTGETFLPPTPGAQPFSEPTGGVAEPGGDEGAGGRGREESDGPRRVRKRRRGRVSWSDSATPPEPTTPSRSAPPPLRRRTSREGTTEGDQTTPHHQHTPVETRTRSGNETDSTLDSVPEESEAEAQEA